MKKNRWGNRSKEKRTSFSTTLADAMKRAAFASRVEGALRRGTFVLWAGGFLVGVAAYWGGQNASAGRGVAVVFLVFVAATVGVEILVALIRKIVQKSSVRERRTLALTAAKRLEKRFPERAENFVAAVEFSVEENGNDERRTDSGALRDATVVSATRRYAELVATLDAAELNAALIGSPNERLGKIGEKCWLCALAVLVNLAVWGISVRCEEGNDGQRTAISGEKNEQRRVLTRRSEENGKDSEIVENGEKEGNNKIARDNAVDEREEARVCEAISLLDLETLISELAQNAEIAESLKEELERTVEEENKESEKRETVDDAATFLLLARELRTNLTRPETGLIAQTRRLNEAARRERQGVEESLAVLSEVRKVGEISGGGKIEKERQVSGKAVAVFLTSSRLTEFETLLTVSGGIGDTRSLGLSRLLRSDSASERRKATLEAAARVGEWRAALRREETAARILAESWRFDAASQRRRTLVRAALQENRALLSRFAGRLTPNVGATSENDESLNEAKRRFNALWNETRLVDKEIGAIFERLRERLQSAEAREFRDFIAKNVGIAGDARFWSVEADVAVDAWLAGVAAQRETWWKKVAESVEMNRFGVAAEYGEKTVATLDDAASTFGLPESESEGEKREKKQVGKEINVEIKGFDGSVREERTENNGNARATGHRFSALAALLTQGVDATITRRFEGRTWENEGKTATEPNGDLTLSREKSEESATTEGVNEDATLEKEETAIETASQSWQDEERGASQSRQDEERGAPEEKEARGTDDATVGKERGSNVAAVDGAESENQNERGTFGGETENGNDANAGAFAGNVGEAEKNRDGAETSKKEAFTGELPTEARRRFEGTEAPEITPEYAEKIRLYRRRILKERR